MALVLIAACGGGSSGSGSSSSTVRVTYKFAGKAEAPKASYTTATGSEERTIVATSAGVIVDEFGVDVPAGKALTVTIEAQHYTENVQCTIVGSDGKVISDNKASGLHGKATCEGAAA